MQRWYPSASLGRVQYESEWPPKGSARVVPAPVGTPEEQDEEEFDDLLEPVRNYLNPKMEGKLLSTLYGMPRCGCCGSPGPLPGSGR